ncbi:MAG: hypothetical protein VB039_05155 [Oscillospiraceae bacterium]|nr:hypothetical protein [Oscillospiraceae bacterium]
MEKVKESDWQNYVRKNYNQDESPSYEDEANILWLLNAPEQAGAEKEMLSYAKKNPEATLKELCEFFDTLFPDGFDGETAADSE